VFVTPHGLDANGPALIGIRWTTHPASSIDIRDFCAGSLAPPRSELISETTDGCVDWTGTVDDGTNSWTLSTFMVSYDPGFINQREQFPDAHGTIDATLTGATGTVTLHVTFSTSM
jgi:hypothetical protein